MPDIDWVWSVASWPSLLLYGTTLKLDFMNWLSVNYWLYRRIYYSVYLQYLPGCFSANFIAENCPGKLNILDVHLSSNVSCTLLKCRIRQNTAEYQLFPDPLTPYLRRGSSTLISAWILDTNLSPVHRRASFINKPRSDLVTVTISQGLLGVAEGSVLPQVETVYLYHLFYFVFYFSSFHENKVSCNLQWFNFSLKMDVYKRIKDVM